MEVAKDPNERLTAKQVSEEFNIPIGTLSHWRFIKAFTPNAPRYHKYKFCSKIFYLRHEIEEDLKGEAF